jgi:hypothetical protein
MSADADRQQLKMREFMQLLPVTTAIAGLPHAELGRPLTDDQLEVRAIVLKRAFKVAKQLMRDIAGPGAEG